MPSRFRNAHWKKNNLLVPSIDFIAQKWGPTALPPHFKNHVFNREMMRMCEMMMKCLIKFLICLKSMINIHKPLRCWPQTHGDPTLARRHDPKDRGVGHGGFHWPPSHGTLKALGQTGQSEASHGHTALRR